MDKEYVCEKWDNLYNVKVNRSTEMLCLLMEVVVVIAICFNWAAIILLQKEGGDISGVDL